MAPMRNSLREALWALLSGMHGCVMTITFARRLVDRPALQRAMPSVARVSAANISRAGTMHCLPAPSFPLVLSETDSSGDVAIGHRLAVPIRGHS